MYYFSAVANYLSKNQRNFFIFLLLFHALLSILLFTIANSTFLLEFHTGNGFWNFARDVETYHNEANFSLLPLQNSHWNSWWNLYPDHKNVRIAALLYWITGYPQPIVYEIINGFTWATSVILIYKTSQLLFPNNNNVSLASISFFFFPTFLLASTQMLRDPIFTLGFCMLCYGFVNLSTEKSKSKFKFIIIALIGVFLAIAIRDYLSSIFLVGLFLMAVIALLQKKMSIAQVLLLVLPLIAFESLTINKHLGQTSQFSINSQEIVLEQIRIKDEDENQELSSLNKSIKKTKKSELLEVNEEAVAKMQILIQRRDIDLNLEQFNIRQEIIIINKEKIDLAFAEEQLDNNAIEKSKAIIKKAQERQNEAVIQQKKIRTKFKTQQQAINLVQQQEIKALKLIAPKSSIISKKLNIVSQKISTMRHGFQSLNKNSGSKIDEIQLFSNFVDIVEYLPRAFQVGFFAPFPNSWIRSGSQVGLIGSILSGMEMMIWYIILLGFIYVCFKNPSLSLPLISTFLISVLVILLMAYVIPNIGTIYRMRQPYMIPFYIVGIYGLNLFYSGFNEANK